MIHVSEKSEKLTEYPYVGKYNDCLYLILNHELAMELFDNDRSTKGSIINYNRTWCGHSQIEYVKDGRVIIQNNPI